MIRAIRLELVRPIGEPWDHVGPLLRTLAKATPKLLNAAYDAKVAVAVAGRDAVKAKIAPDAKAESGDGLAYQAVLRQVEGLRAWGEKRGHAFASLEVPGGMASAIARSACQAYARRDQQRVTFAAERILVRAAETTLAKDERGIVLAIGLRCKGRVRFACAHSWGTHRETLDAIVSKAIAHGDCKLQWDERRKKWYALLSYDAPDPAPLSLDPARALAVHRGMRNALFLLPSTGQRANSLPGSKFLAQRKALQARMRDIRHTSNAERGGGAKGHGRARRFESYSALEDKLARVTHTFCQQAAAYVVTIARERGCSLVLIEDYGGIEPHEDVEVRRKLDRFPFYELKQCIEHALQKAGMHLRESPSAFISATCPRCESADTRHHNIRTGIFHCATCGFERPADWVAAYWLLKHGGADMGPLGERLRRERELADKMKGAGNGERADDNREAC